MGCWTIYVVRELDASVWASGMKYGPVELAPAELEELLANNPERWEPTSIDRTWCRGVYLDRRAQRVRVYSCWCTNYDPMALDQRMREHAGWAGWDVGVAFEQDVDFNVLLGLPPRDDHSCRLDGWVGFPEAGCLTRHPVRDRWVFEWDRATDTLVYEYYLEHSIETVVTTIDAHGRVHDYAFDDDVLFEALGHGPALLDDLATIAPVPELWRARAGALIDLPERTIWLWLHEPVAPALYDALRARWSGWRVEREPGGIAGHLERTGRDGDLEQPVVKRYDLPPRALHYVEAIPDRNVELPALPDDEARLLDAIHADLGSDAARLVYADLLLAKGDQRGKLIAVQCELARLERQDRRSARQYSLAAVANDLRRAYGRENVSGGSELRYERGFIAHVAVDSVEKLAEYRVLERARTVDSLRVQKLAARSIPLLAAQPALARLRAFTTTPEPGALRALVEVEAFPNLERLEIDTRDPVVARELGTLLAGAHPFCGVRELRLCGQGFDGAATRATLEGRLDRLETLYCGRLASLDEPAMRDLSRCEALGRLQRIVIWGAPSDELAAILMPRLLQVREWTTDLACDSVRLLETLPGLRALTLRFHGQSETLVPALAASPHLARLEALSLTHIGAPAVAALADSPFLDGIGVLHLAQLFGDNQAALTRLSERLGDRLAITTW